MIVVATLIVTVQGPVPAHTPPVQPVNLEPRTPFAVSVTRLLPGYVAEHALPQLMPAGVLTILPQAVPAFWTLRTTGNWSNVAVTTRAALMLTVQAPVPVQRPRSSPRRRSRWPSWV